MSQVLADGTPVYCQPLIFEFQGKYGTATKVTLLRKARFRLLTVKVHIK